MRLFNPTKEQLDLYNEIGADAENRVVYLKDQIARLQSMLVELPAKNEKGENILSGVNETINGLIKMYQQELSPLEVLIINTRA